MKEISKIASGVQASTTLAIDAMFKQMKADGVDVIGFGAGEPDFNTPEHIKRAAVEAINQNKTRYTPAAGIKELREGACKRLLEDCGLEYEPGQIVAASGAKHNVYIALQVLLNPGDEVILPAPYWLSYSEMIQMAGGVPVIVTASEQDDFKITAQQLEAAITPKTKALILNNPSNPTGMLYTKQELEPIAQVCVEHDLYVISDEIYYGLVYDGREFTSFARLGPQVKERTILINGVSKSYAMTGWRIGYAAANKELAAVMSNYLSHSTSAPSSISQWAAVEALHGSQEAIRTMRAEFERRRNYIVERMNRIPGVSARRPEGAFYVMMNIEKLLGRRFGPVTVQSAEDFAHAFLEQGLVAVVPCTDFGAPGFVRWSYATSMENIQKGLNRLEQFLA
ncbi:MAG: pyridoxal phosphate-dependent aminotransferase [Oscillospiraceae bacterium]|nr:pyridoxal phosphate-dependent aminotransferase [Oscillospiraceae bacterium]